MRRGAGARRTLTAVLAALAVGPAHACAHGVSSDVRFQSDGLRPAVPGFALEVAVTGGRVTATNRSPETVLVLDAAGQPLYRLRADRVVERRTPTGWSVVGRTGSVTWHDHRTGPPPSGRLPVFARIPVEAGARRAVLEGVVSRRAAQESASPWWLLSLLPLLGLAGLAHVVVTRRAPERQ